jgi:hypothetical protein
LACWVGSRFGGWAGLAPRGLFLIFFDFFFSFSFETILFEFKFGIKLELKLSKTFSVHMELKKWVFDNKR